MHQNIGRKNLWKKCSSSWSSLLLCVLLDQLTSRDRKRAKKPERRSRLECSGSCSKGCFPEADHQPAAKQSTKTAPFRLRLRLLWRTILNPQSSPQLKSSPTQRNSPQQCRKLKHPLPSRKKRNPPNSLRQSE